MPLVSMQDILNHSVKGKYTTAAFNVFSVESVNAVLEGAEKENSPVIIQLSMGARKYVKNAPAFINYLKARCQDSCVPVALNHDHCSSVEAAFEALDWGLGCVMFDGSHLPLEENISATRLVVEKAKKTGAVVEAELGQLPGFEDLVFAEHCSFTDPELAKKFVDTTGCFSLAVSVGTSHGGVIADDYLIMNFEVLKKIHDILGDFPLVLHGAASLPPELIDTINAVGGKVPYWRNCCEADIAKAAEYGVAKANMDVDNFVCFTREVRRYLNEYPEKYDPRKYLADGSIAFRNEVIHKIRNVVKSSGRNWL